MLKKMYMVYIPMVFLIFYFQLDFKLSYIYLIYTNKKRYITNLKKIKS